MNKLTIGVRRSLEWGLITLFDEATREDIPELSLSEGEVRLFTHTLMCGARHRDDGDTDLTIDVYLQVPEGTSHALGIMSLPSGSLAILTSLDGMDRRIIPAGNYSVSVSYPRDDFSEVVIGLLPDAGASPLPR